MSNSMRSPLSWSLLVSLLLALGACASAGPPRTGEEPDESTAGYPYTRNQLRDAFKVGTLISLRIEEGRKVHFEDQEVIAADKSGCTIATRVVTEKGEVVEDKGSETHTWQELQAMASHPLEETVISEGTLKSFIGEIETWLYVHTTHDADGRPMQSYHHYAKTLPGPPVLETVTVDGKMVKRISMVGRR